MGFVFGVEEDLVFEGVEVGESVLVVVEVVGLVWVGDLEVGFHYLCKIMISVQIIVLGAANISFVTLIVT